jgi:putative intracellular protease/amidase
MNYVWKILEIYADDGLISSAKYLCSVNDGENTVETEGYWSFPEAGTVPFSDITEEMIAKWIEDSAVVDGKNIIKSRLAEQLQTLSKKPVPAPWLPQTFTPDL